MAYNDLIYSHRVSVAIECGSLNQTRMPTGRGIEFRLPSELLEGSTPSRAKRICFSARETGMGSRTVKGGVTLSLSAHSKSALLIN